MIEVQSLTKYYGNHAAISEVSFTADRGEVLGFLGPNGAGKTTTMRILTGYMPASSGTAKVAGFDVFEESRQVRERVGYLPESPPLYKEMTPTSYLDFVARIKGVPRRQRADAVGRALEATAIADVAGQPIDTLSRGYKQRVAIAQAIVHEPEVVILDEPTIGLDPKQIISIRELIQTLAEDRTVVLCTHILPEVTQLCDKVVIISRGRIVAEDTIDSLTATENLEEVFLRVTAGDVAERADTLEEPEAAPEPERRGAGGEPEEPERPGLGAEEPDAGEPAAADEDGEEESR